MTPYERDRLCDLYERFVEGWEQTGDLGLLLGANPVDIFAAAFGAGGRKLVFFWHNGQNMMLEKI